MQQVFFIYCTHFLFVAIDQLNEHNHYKKSDYIIKCNQKQNCTWHCVPACCEEVKTSLIINSSQTTANVSPIGTSTP